MDSIFCLYNWTPMIDGRVNILLTAFFVVFKIISRLSSDTIRFIFKLFDGSRINVPANEFC